MSFHQQVQNIAKYRCKVQFHGETRDVDNVDYKSNFFLSTRIYTGWGKSKFTLVSMQKQFMLVLFINYCIIFHMNNYKPPFAPPSVFQDV